MMTNKKVFAFLRPNISNWNEWMKKKEITTVLILFLLGVCALMHRRAEVIARTFVLPLCMRSPKISWTFGIIKESINRNALNKIKFIITSKIIKIYGRIHLRCIPFACSLFQLWQIRLLQWCPQIINSRHTEWWT